MSKRKPSLFERLTGAITIDELEEDLEQEGSSDNEARHITPRHDEDSDVSQENLDNEEGQLGVDMYETDKEIIIKSIFAGVRPDDLDISITREMVTIKGKREVDNTVETNDYFHQELYWGSFSRTIILPDEVEVEEAQAIEKHGLLIIRLPKLNKNRQTKLKVKSS